MNGKKAFELSSKSMMVALPLSWQDRSNNLALFRQSKYLRLSVVVQLARVFGKVFVRIFAEDQKKRLKYPEEENTSSANITLLLKD